MPGADQATAEAAPEPAADRLEPAPATPRAVAVTAALPEAPAPPRDAEKAAPALASRPPTPPRLRPLDILLIICTFGIYGLVLWARQRKPA
jgi:hypothetical protein